MIIMPFTNAEQNASRPFASSLHNYDSMDCFKLYRKMSATLENAQKQHPIKITVNLFEFHGTYLDFRGFSPSQNGTFPNKKKITFFNHESPCAAIRLVGWIFTIIPINDAKQAPISANTERNCKYSHLHRISLNI